MNARLTRRRSSSWPGGSMKIIIPKPSPRSPSRDRRASCRSARGRCPAPSCRSASRATPRARRRTGSARRSRTARCSTAVPRPAAAARPRAARRRSPRHRGRRSSSVSGDGTGRVFPPGHRGFKYLLRKVVRKCRGAPHRPGGCRPRYARIRSERRRAVTNTARRRPVPSSRRPTWRRPISPIDPRSAGRPASTER